VLPSPQSKLAAVAYAAKNLAALDAVDVHDHAAVVEQQHIACGHVVDQLRVIQADTFRIAELAVRIENELLASLEQNLAASEFADANLRTLQIGHHADGAPRLLRHFAH